MLIRLTGAHLYFHLLAPLTILFVAIIIMNTTFSYESQNVFKTYFRSSGHSGKRGKYSNEIVHIINLCSPHADRIKIDFL